MSSANLNHEVLINNCKKHFSNRIIILINPEMRASLGIKCNIKYFTEMNLSHLVARTEPLSNAQFGKICAVSGQTVSDWISAKFSPSIKHLICLSTAFDVSIDWLLGKNDTISQEIEDEYAVFKKYGFSSDTYNMLRKLKKQSASIDKLMYGINVLFNYKREHEVTWETYRLRVNQLDKEGDYIKTMTLEDVENTQYDLYRLIEAPAIQAITDYFTLNTGKANYFLSKNAYSQIWNEIKSLIYPEETDTTSATTFSMQPCPSDENIDEIEKLCNDIDTYKTKLSSLARLIDNFVHPSTVDETEGALVSKFNRTMQACKLNLIEEKFNCLPSTVKELHEGRTQIDACTEKELTEYYNSKGLFKLKEYYNR